MFKTERSAKYALFGLMAFFGLSIFVFYIQGLYDRMCLGLGMELICYWAYLNPWILHEKYALFMFIDRTRMVQNRFLAVGGLISFGSAVVIFLRWTG